MPGNIVVGVLALAAVVFALRSMKKRAESGCCGGGGDCCRVVKAEDTDPSHYPYSAVMEVFDMHCENCRTRVESALNSLPGVWASVDLGKKEALVRMKEVLTEDRLRETVKKAGYGVGRVEFR